MIVTEKVLGVLVDVADTLVDDFDIIDFLHDLTMHVAEVTAATTVGLVLADENQQLQFMAASTNGAKAVELLQLQATEGPCLDCYRTGTPVIVHDLHDASDRWPTFAPGALDHGVRSVHAFPMRLRGHVLGALNVFSDELRPLEPDEIKLIQAMADVATIAIIQERSVANARVLSTQLQNALDSRIVIEQAKGALAQILNVDPDTAFDLLRHNARRQQQSLTELAEDVIHQSVNYTTWEA